MGLLSKLGGVALDALDAAARRVEEARERKAAAAAPAESTKPAEPKSTKPAEAKSAEPQPSAPKPAPAMLEEIGDANIAVQVFGRMTCPFTRRALRLLEDRDIDHVYTELAAPGGYALAPRLASTTGQRTVPYVYLRGKFVGGYDGLDEIDRLGQLDEMIKSDDERAASGPPRIRIQVPPRNS